MESLLFVSASSSVYYTLFLIIFLHLCTLNSSLRMWILLSEITCEKLISLQAFEVTVWFSNSDFKRLITLEKQPEENQSSDHQFFCCQILYFCSMLPPTGLCTGNHNRKSPRWSRMLLWLLVSCSLLFVNISLHRKTTKKASLVSHITLALARFHRNHPKPSCKGVQWLSYLSHRQHLTSVSMLNKLFTHGLGITFLKKYIIHWYYSYDDLWWWPNLFEINVYLYKS